MNRSYLILAGLVFNLLASVFILTSLYKISVTHDYLINIVKDILQREIEKEKVKK